MAIEADLKKFFSDQDRSSKSFLATLEQMSEPAGSIKITPFGAGGCGCDRAMVVAANHIESVEAVADQWHDCCGKRLQVARVGLKPDATVRVSDLLAARTPHETVHPDLPGRGQECWKQELQCIARGTPYGLCHSWYEDCLERNFGPDRNDVSSLASGGGPACYDGCVQAFAECRNSGQNKNACAQRFSQCTRRCHYDPNG